MTISRRQLLSKVLAGTVSFPPTFPQLARLSVLSARVPVSQGGHQTLLRVEHQLSPTLTIIRTLNVADVSAVFLPRDPRQVSLDDGLWLMGEEIPSHFAILQQNSPLLPTGIVRLPEQAQVLMLVEVGMTAAESAEYYPPLACERFVNHYQIPAVKSQARQASAYGDTSYGDCESEKEGFSEGLVLGDCESNEDGFSERFQFGDCESKEDGFSERFQFGDCESKETE